MIQGITRCCEIGTTLNDQAVQSKVWEHSTARLVKHMPELESVQVGGDDGMLDLSDAHAMDWVVQ